MHFNKKPIGLKVLFCIFLELGHKSLDQLQAGTLDMFMIPGLIHLLLILTKIHDSYGGGTTVTGKVIYQGYWQLFGSFFFKLFRGQITQIHINHLSEEENMKFSP